MEEHSNIDKGLLITQLLVNERKKLRLKVIKKDIAKLRSEKLKRKRLINEQLLQEKVQIFGKKIENEQSTSRTATRTELPSTVPFPSIQRHRLHNFLKLLSEDEKLNTNQKGVRKCVADMNSTMKCHWNLPITILRAVKDCILHRKWNNLTHLLLVLIKLPTYKYKSLIRHLCHILDKVHPAIKENGLTGQLQIVQKAPHLIKKQ